VSTHELRIYGASDDLIEIDGAIREEFGAYDSDAVLIGISDGTLLRVRYDEDGDGTWRIRRVRPGSGELTITASEDREEGSYTDEAILVSAAPFVWVLKGSELAL